jgi:hypothetical protein
VTLPTADDLFRPTAPSDTAADAAPDPGSDDTGPDIGPDIGPDAGAPSATPARRRTVSAVPEPSADTSRGRRTSGRVRHDEKMTVYVTAEELLEIEHTRLSLRRDHGLAVDRGRLVREALAIVLADLEEHGDDSELVRRLVR